MSTTLQETSQKISQTFFDNMGIHVESVTAVVSNEERNIINVTIQSDDSAILIGPHWATRERLEHLVTLLLERNLKARARIHLEVNDYLKSQRDKMLSMIDQKIEVLKAHPGEMTLVDLNSYDRRLVHAHVSEKWLEWLRSYSDTDEAGKRVLHLSYEWSIADQIDIDGIDV